MNDHRCVTTCPPDLELAAPRRTGRAIGIGLGTLSAIALPITSRAATIEVAAGAFVQAAIDAATDGDELVLAPGTYLGTIDLRGRAIMLRSQNPGDPAVVAATILHGGGVGPVITCWSGESTDTVLAGLTLTGGAGMSGGGAYIDGASPTFRQCRFVANAATFEGGGAFCVGGSPLFVSCDFRGNTAFYGGGLSMLDGDPMVVNTVFSGNVAHATGGGVDNFFDAHAELVNCSFTNNTADVGGAVATTGGAPTLANCVLYGNTSLTADDELHDMGDLPTLVWYSNVRGSGGSAAWNPMFGTDGGGNIDADPRFADADGPDDTPGTADDDLRLVEGSPSLDAGDNGAVPADLADLDGDGNTIEPMGLGVDGEARFSDAPGAPSTGRTDTRVTDRIVDMGPYELQAPDSRGCTGDLDGSGWVGFRDLVSLLRTFGDNCAACPEDLDGDGHVDFDDLRMLVDNWGWCAAAEKPRKPRRSRRNVRRGTGRCRRSESASQKL